MSSLKTIGSVNFPSTVWKYEWKIKNFLSYSGKDARYRSPCFSLSDFEWFIVICPDGLAGKRIDSTGWISLYLHQTKKGPGNINFGLGILSVNNVIEELTSITNLKNPSWGWPKFMTKSELLQRKSELLPSGDLTIVCLIDIKGAAPNFGTPGPLLEGQRNTEQLCCPLPPQAHPQVSGLALTNGIPPGPLLERQRNTEQLCCPLPPQAHPQVSGLALTNGIHCLPFNNINSNIPNFPVLIQGQLYGNNVLPLSGVSILSAPGPSHQRLGLSDQFCAPLPPQPDPEVSGLSSTDFRNAAKTNSDNNAKQSNSTLLKKNRLIDRSSNKRKQKVEKSTKILHASKTSFNAPSPVTGKQHKKKKTRSPPKSPESDEVIILPTPPKLQPPEIIISDDEENLSDEENISDDDEENLSDEENISDDDEEI